MVKKKRPKSTPEADLFKIANFILLNTLIIHETLASNDPQIVHLDQLTNKIQAEFIRIWQYIIDRIDYKPIFSLGKKILENLPSSLETEELLQKLTLQTQSIIKSGVLLRHDLMGRIYHKMLLKTTGGFYATYYTSIPAAILLSNLILKTPHKSWKFDSDAGIEDFLLIDPACGSGTLLSSSYSALRDQYVIFNPSRNVDWLHETLMERVIWGFDVQEFATHLSLTTLALHNPGKSFGNSNIYTLPNGIGNDKKVYLGSIDYLAAQQQLQVQNWTSVPTRMTQNARDAVSNAVLVNPSSFDVVVMNPPFSRSAKPNLKFGYADKATDKRMKIRLKELTLGAGVKAIGTAGLGANFILVGNRLLKPGGRIGIIIPRSILSGVSWAEIRTLLAEKYDLQYILSNFDPDSNTDSVEGWSWSENTDIGEVLVIAQKKTPRNSRNEKEHNVLFVNVLAKPKNEVESLFLTQEIINKKQNLMPTLDKGGWKFLMCNNSPVASIYYLKQSDLNPNWLIPCVFAHPQLNQFVIELFRNPNFTPLQDLVDFEDSTGTKKKFGRDIGTIKKNFDQSSTPTPFPMIWGHQKNMDRMFLDNSFIGYGQPKTSLASSMFVENKATLLLGTRFHINIEGTLAAEAERAVLATAFWQITLAKGNEPWFPVLILWFNSTFGFALILSHCDNSQGQIFQLKQGNLPTIPVPSKIDFSAAQTLYDRVKNTPFRANPEEFQLARQGSGLRKQIDDFFIAQFQSQFNFKLDLQPLYALLVKEPILTLKRYTP